MTKVKNYALLAFSLFILILGVAAVYAQADVSKLYPITFVSCIVLGAAGQFVWKGLFDSITPGVSTYLGLNDK